MPANNRDRKVREEAQYFCKTKSLYPIQCKHFKPTLAELQSTTFSDYVRDVVLSQCEEGYDDDEEEIVVEESHGTRSKSKSEKSRRHIPNSRKITYDYGESFRCLVVAYFFSADLIVNSLFISHAPTSIAVLTIRTGKGNFTRGIIKPRGYSEGFHWEGGRMAVGDADRG